MPCGVCCPPSPSPTTYHSISKAWRPMIISMGTECVPHLPRLSTTKASVPESDRAQRFRKFDTGKHHAKFICLFQCTEEACSYRVLLPCRPLPLHGTELSPSFIGHGFSSGCRRKAQGGFPPADLVADPAVTQFQTLQPP